MRSATPPAEFQATIRVTYDAPGPEAAQELRIGMAEMLFDLPYVMEVEGIDWKVRKSNPDAWAPKTYIDHETGEENQP